MVHVVAYSRKQVEVYFAAGIDIFDFKIQMTVTIDF